MWPQEHIVGILNCTELPASRIERSKTMDERRGQAYHRRFSPLYTDYYEYSMTQGYYLSGKGQDEAVFDIFYRQNPYGGGYAIAAGLRDAVEYVLNMRFTSEELGYLSSLGYKDDFLSLIHISEP